MTLTFADPSQIWLEIPAASQTEAWQRSQSLSTPGARWTAYLNQLCLATVLPWLQAEYDPKAAPWPRLAALTSYWDVVDGTAVSLGATRLVLLPSEAIDASELRVPQEWVDIPSWAGDYYLGVQVNPDQQWLRIWGYTSHRDLKQAQNYDGRDRTYSLAAEQLLLDLTVLPVAQQLCPQEPQRAAVADLPVLSPAQAYHLLQRLGHPSLTWPRLAVPFGQWAALLEHGGWRQQLYARRQGLPEQWSVLQWLHNRVSDLAQQAGWQQVSQPGLAGARGEVAQTALALVRPLHLENQPYDLWIIPQDNSSRRVWRFELRQVPTGRPIPRGYKLRILTEDLQAFAQNEAVAIAPVDRLYVEVTLDPGEGLVWEVEPTPANYDREILRF